MTNNNYINLAAIDVGDKIEKKGNLSYLSWAWAVDRLLRADAAANWEFHEPKYFGETVMVSCTVTAFGKPVTMHLPVMGNRNEALKNPDAVQINKNMMRCLVKAIACHGLGLYIYAGEDLPEVEAAPVLKISAEQVSILEMLIEQMGTDVSKILGYYKVISLEDLPATAYDVIYKRLNDARLKGI